MQKQNLSQGGFVPKNRQHNRKTKYPDKVTKPKCLVFVRIFLFSSVGIKIQYFPTAPSFKVYKYINRLPLRQAPFPDFSAEKQWRRLQNR